MLKRVIQTLCLGLAVPLWLCWRGCALFLEKERSFQGMSQALSLWPGISGSLIRSAFYRLALSNTSRNTAIGFLTTFSSSSAILHDHVSTGVCCNLGWVELGEHCILGSHICITSGKRQHEYADLTTPVRLQGGTKERVRIGRDCWIGNSATVLADVGEGSVIAAGSVVTHPVPPFSIAAGNPARIIGSRT